MQALHRALISCGVLAALGALAGSGSGCSSGDVTFSGSGTTTGDGASAGFGEGGSGGAGGGSGASGGAAGEGGSGGKAGTPCNLETDGPDACGEGFYCEAVDCAAGTCQPIPDNNDNVAAPVCGCDNVIYWNAHTAAAFGASVAKPGRCDDPIRCDGPTSMACPEDKHTCGKLFESLIACSNLAAGRCWGLPDECPATSFGGQYRSCLNPGAFTCLDECEALKAEEAHYFSQDCPQ